MLYFLFAITAIVIVKLVVILNTLVGSKPPSLVMHAVRPIVPLVDLRIVKIISASNNT